MSYVSLGILPGGCVVKTSGSPAAVGEYAALGQDSKKAELRDAKQGGRAEHIAAAKQIALAHVRCKNTYKRQSGGKAPSGAEYEAFRTASCPDTFKTVEELLAEGGLPIVPLAIGGALLAAVAVGATVLKKKRQNPGRRRSRR